MEPKAKFTIKHQITDRDTDFLKKLKLSALFAYFQDIAGFHSDNIGVGIDALREAYNVAWILMRVSVEVIRMPSAYEKITVDTWPQSPAAIYDRDYTVTDADGNIIIRAVSSWIMMDIDKRGIMKSKVSIFEDIDYITERALDRRPIKLSAAAALEHVSEQNIGYSTIDYNRHLNNTRYLDFAMDCIDLDYLERHEVVGVDINYIHEVKVGEVLALYRDLSEVNSGKIMIEGLIGGETAFRTRLTFVPHQL